MLIRAANAGDMAAIARFFRVIVAAGESYAYPENLDERGIADLWLESPPGRCVVAVSDTGVVVRSAKMGPNRPGRGAHIATARFMVDPVAQGQGIGRAGRGGTTLGARTGLSRDAIQRGGGNQCRGGTPLALVGLRYHDDDPRSVRAFAAWPGRLACAAPTTLNEQRGRPDEHSSGLPPYYREAACPVPTG